MVIFLRASAVMVFSFMNGLFVVPSHPEEPDNPFWRTQLRDRRANTDAEFTGRASAFCWRDVRQPVTRRCARARRAPMAELPRRHGRMIGSQIDA